MQVQKLLQDDYCKDCVHLTIWKESERWSGPLTPLYCDDKYYEKLKRIPNKKVALKLNIILLKIMLNSNLYYVMVLNYADGGTINNFIYINMYWYWIERLRVLSDIIKENSTSDVYISDMGLSGEIALYCNSIGKDKEIEKQFKEAEEYRKANYSSIGQLTNHHPQAYYTS
ncbi:hypothetical protein C1646_774461 [Rhizophagus diaphanus]|nr:hypothetical protein C1646_774461 [Rhizophagus diaphanus] [Rhizophagus sp. MUCL 43196]